MIEIDYWQHCYLAELDKTAAIRHIAQKLPRRAHEDGCDTGKGPERDCDCVLAELLYALQAQPSQAPELVGLTDDTPTKEPVCSSWPPLPCSVP